MAAQDLQISHYRSPIASPRYDADPSAKNGASVQLGQILLQALRKRWKLVVAAVVISGGVAYLSAMLLGRNTATANASVLYAGLPSTLGVNLSDTIGPETAKEMLTSVPVLEKLRERRNIGLSAASLSRMIQANVAGNSALMRVSLGWSDSEEAVAVLNDLVEIFIDEMANQRKAVLQSYVEHADMSVLKQKLQADEVRRQCEAFSQERTQQLKGGRAPVDRYREAFDDAQRAERETENNRTRLAGTQDQITALDQDIAANQTLVRKTILASKQDIVRQLTAQLNSNRDRYARHSSYYQYNDRLVGDLSRFAARSRQDQDFDKWQVELSALLRGASAELPSGDQAPLQQIYDQLISDALSTLSGPSSRQRELESTRHQLQLSLLPLRNEIDLSEKRRTEYAATANSLSAQATAAAPNQQVEAEQKSEEVEDLLRLVTMQRDSLRLLQESRIREWSVSVPAMDETTTTVSNRRKVFALSYALCGLVLIGPMVLMEWHQQRDLPQVAFARSLHLPILAGHGMGRRRGFIKDDTQPAIEDPSQCETMRLLTLRIQQTCHRSGAVVLFSSLDPAVCAAQLIAGVAKCLADREERVLLVDAVCPERARMPILNLFSAEQGSSPRESVSVAAPARVATQPGLSEMFAGRCRCASDLIRPTDCPGVDLISSGSAAFEREAMASSALTELLTTCRQNYTTILVHGPAAIWAADLQMLTARADGVVLTASRGASRDPHAREVVEELLGLGAPIIGVVV